MSASLESMTLSRFACIFFQSYADPNSVPEACRTGEPDWKHFRDHMKKKHICKCVNNCETPMHFSANHIENILELRKKPGDPYHALWTDMYRLAHPDTVHAPAPYLPTFSQALAVARDPTVGFAKLLVLNFANQGGTSQEEATKNMITFCRYLPVFHDTLSRIGPRPASHTVSRAVTIEDHPSTSVFTSDEYPLQLPTPAADTYASSLDPESTRTEGRIVGEMAQDVQEHMDFLEKEWKGYFA
ncbi:hypothetical protein FLAG1_06063 [Fusarium langsethiae]|uniref:Uncharacterized protein n=1 Tax=Fusarium langsethiae TaxID=179993 RepID=A0A0N0V6U6_FUSLA|nr:hypothetical protein FLAG1_06063 [Fusarium langsethiae]GKU04516.1 unnamed protein product [Fusarium langsethiae]GKU20451.1 unnamed protein product [Fusarium langsethiae]